MKKWPIVVGALVVIGFIGSMNGENSEKTTSSPLPSASTRVSASQSVSPSPSKQTSAVTSAEPALSNTAKTETRSDTEEKWAKHYINNNIEIQWIDQNVLFEYGEYFEGVTVCTAIDISSTSTGALKANTDNNDSYFFSFVMNFEDKAESAVYENDETVIVIGIPEKSTIGSAINMNDCHVIGSGEDAKTKQAELASESNVQIMSCEEIKAEAEAAQLEIEIADKQAYIESCESVVYTDVERNPNTYEGKSIKFSGTVIQVSEGWFNSVTLRVSDSGNVWYVTYARKDENESRILEDDYVTVYGECNGVQSYTTILGNKVTIPAVKAKFID